METEQAAGHTFNIYKTNFYQRNGHKSTFYRRTNQACFGTKELRTQIDEAVLHLTTEMPAHELPVTHHVRQLKAREAVRSLGMQDETHFEKEVDGTDS